ncbi:fumarylacetoacetate hydrolase family protein [Allostreptomyces psammosilenae]|uniref:fumarylacetoacetase n=1 Tax=Allostreptomyces psammosilenae TaxID=1892865 RepID=A0A852ZSD0_9ACTN|nr:fumarylacetoacetate hydrolase family protein [Allostreptomyces psammosilenae]NYI04180.1 fumarylacetoacetase [Allostreptomyces psammosilenae]
MSTPWLPVPDGSPFGVRNLPYGVFTPRTRAARSDGVAGRPSRAGRRRIGTAVGDWVLDLAAASRATGAVFADLLDAPHLGPLMAAGRPTWTRVRRAVTTWLTDPSYRATLTPHLYPRAEVTSHLPFEVADYVDFCSNEHHAANMAAMLGPGRPALPPAWKHVPIGRHGRAGTVVVSGTPIRRPHGAYRPAPDAPPVFGPSRRLDIEAEIGFVVGFPTPPGFPVALPDLRRHVFGVCLVNDWSARDIEALEYQPLGPFLGKSFATSVSPWLVPLDALEEARVRPPRRDVAPPSYLDDRDGEPWGLDITLEIALNGHPVSRPPFATTYWTPAQQLAHLTVGGAPLRTGDLFASGAVSGPRRDQRGSLMELSWAGQEPLDLPDGTRRSFLADGDTVSVGATAPGPRGTRIGFGEVVGRVEPA